MKIHENIVTMRKRTSKSQSYVADALGISRVAYGKVERGESSVTFDRIQEICTIFNCTVNELINISNNQPLDIGHVTSKLSPKSDFENLIGMSKLRHQYEDVLKHLYQIHQDHFHHELFAVVITNLETFIEHSHYSVADGFVDDFVAYMQQLEDANEYARQ